MKYLAKSATWYYTEASMLWKTKNRNNGLYKKIYFLKVEKTIIEYKRCSSSGLVFGKLSFLLLTMTTYHMRQYYPKTFGAHYFMRQLSFIRRLPDIKELPEEDLSSGHEHELEAGTHSEFQFNNIPRRCAFYI